MSSLRPLLLAIPAFLAVSTCAKVPNPFFGVARPGASSGAHEPPAPPPADEPPALDRLRALGVRFRPWRPPARRLNERVTCAVDDGIVLLRGPTGVRYSKSPLLASEFAVRLARFEAIVQEEAARALGARVVRIEHFGTYVCRAVAGYPGVASQHAFGNAIDVAAFVLRDGRRVTVLRDFVRAGGTPATPSQLFLQGLTRRVRAEALFGAVLTPDYDSRHANHLHLDGRPRRWWWWRLSS